MKDKVNPVPAALCGLLGVLILGSSHLKGLCPVYPHHACSDCRVAGKWRGGRDPREATHKYLEEAFPGGFEIACTGGLTLGSYPSGIRTTVTRNGEEVEVKELLYQSVMAGTNGIPRKIFRQVIRESRQKVLVVLAGSNDVNMLFSNTTSRCIAEWLYSHLSKIVLESSCWHVVLSSILPRREDTAAKFEKKESINKALLALVRRKPFLPNREQLRCRVHFLNFRNKFPSSGIGVAHTCPQRTFDLVHLRGSVMELWVGELVKKINDIKACGPPRPVHQTRRGGRRSYNKKKKTNKNR